MPSVGVIVSELRELLWKVPCPNLKNERGWTGLHLAALRNCTECTKILITHGASVDSTTVDGKSPGHFAALCGNVASLTVLLESTANVDAADKLGWTMLHKAAFHGRLNCCKLLIDNMADPLAKTMAGETPLHLAAREGHAEVVQFLLSLNENWVTQLELRTDFGDTPKHLAMKFQKRAVLEILQSIEWGRELTPKDGSSIYYPGQSAALAGDLDQIHKLIDSGVIAINDQDDQGNTLLHKAIEGDHIHCVNWLIQNGADFSQKNISQESPFDMAERINSESISELLNASKNEKNSACTGFLDQKCNADIGSNVVERIVLLDNHLRLAKAEFFQRGGREIDLVKYGIHPERSNADLLAELQHERIVREEMEIELDELRKQLFTAKNKGITNT